MRSELDGDTAFVMAGDTAWHFADEHKLANFRPSFGDKKNTRKRVIENFALHDFAVGTGEINNAICLGAIMMAKLCFFERDSIDVTHELLRDAFALVCGAIELNAEGAFFRARDIAFKTAKAVNVHNDMSASRRHDFGQYARATW